MGTFKKGFPAEIRDEARITEHYLLEKSLSNQLRQSTRQERLDQNLYTTLYNELFCQISHHTQLSRQSTERTDYLITQRVRFLEHFLVSNATFLEIGCGSGHLISKVADKVQKVYAVDVSDELTKNIVLPANVSLIISNGINIPVPEASVDVAYSHQLMEHLHPEDAREQLQEIYQALKPGGKYICVTPNRLCGPHDISRYFDEVATGFHLKEYTVSDLFELFQQVGFGQTSLYKIYRQAQIFQFPLTSTVAMVLRGCEQVLSWLPYQLRRQIANTPLLFRSITMVGTK